MWISMVLMAILASAFAAPQNLQEYQVQSIHGPTYRVSNSNSGFSIESSGSSSSGSLGAVSGQSSFGASGLVGSGIHSSESLRSLSGVQSLSGINSHQLSGINEHLSGVHGQVGSVAHSSETLRSSSVAGSGIGSHQTGQTFAVAHPLVQQVVSSHESGSAQDSIGTSQLSQNFNEQSSLVSQSDVSSNSGASGAYITTNPHLINSPIVVPAARHVSSFTSQVGNAQRNAASVVGRASGITYANGALVGGVSPAVHQQTAYASRSRNEGSHYIVPSVARVSNTYSGAAYGERSAGSVSGLDNGSQFSVVAPTHVGQVAQSASFQKSSSAQNAFGVSGTSNSHARSGIHQGSSYANYGHGVSSGVHASGVQRGVSGAAQRGNVVYGVQPYGVLSAKSTSSFSPVATNFGFQSTKSAFSHSGSGIHSGSTSGVSGSHVSNSYSRTGLVQPSYAGVYGARVGSIGSQKSVASGLGAARVAYTGSDALSGFDSSAYNGALDASISRIGSSIQSGSGNQFYRGVSGVQSAGARQASYNAAGSVVSNHGLAGSALQNSYILKQAQDQAEDGSQFNFSYDTDNGISVQSSGLVRDLGTDGESQVVSGSYSYLGDDGQTYTVDYVADENGFHPQGAHLHPVPEEIARSIEYNLAHPEEVTIQ